MDDSIEHGDDLTHWPQGLYPNPTADREYFYLLGLLVARSILDSRIMDLKLNLVFVEIILDRKPSLSLRSLSLVDRQLSETLQRLKLATGNDCFDGLYFTHPSYSTIELCPQGALKKITLENFEEFLDELLRYVLEASLHEFVSLFRAGFSTVIPIEAFSILTAQDFLRLVNGEVDLEWDAEFIRRSFKADHGFTKDSEHLVWLSQAFADLCAEEKGQLVQFLTGAPQLPPGGWGELRPPLTVVCRTSDSPDRDLPTVMTCANYLKLPKYSTMQILKAKLKMAIHEGRGSFLLS